MVRHSSRLCLSSGNVYLDAIDGQAPEQAQGGETGAEVVDGDLHPQRLETGEEPQTVIHALDDALGHLDLQPLGRKTGLGQNGCHPLHVVVGAHLPDRHIDREPGHGEPFGQPLLPLPAGGAHHPFAQRFDETALLCHRNETVRGYHAKAGMLPADQGLQAAEM